MISFDDALQLAREKKENIDGCTEYENGYVFGFSGDEGYVGGYGHSPIVVLKEDGQLMTMNAFVIRGMGKEIRDFDI